jgi:hypothetical protein
MDAIKLILPQLLVGFVFLFFIWVAAIFIKRETEEKKVKKMVIKIAWIVTFVVVIVFIISF